MADITQVSFIRWNFFRPATIHTIRRHNDGSASQSVSCNVDENNLTAKSRRRRVSRGLKVKTKKVSPEPEPEPGQQQLVHSSAASFFLSPSAFPLFSVFVGLAWLGIFFWWMLLANTQKMPQRFSNACPTEEWGANEGGCGKRGWGQECRRVGQMKREI